MTDIIPFPDKKYNIIYADPPYHFPNKKYQGGNRDFGNIVSDRYETLSDKQLCTLPVENITKPDCILFLWVTDSHLERSFSIINAWGFRFATIGFTWVKKYKSGSYCYNFGHYTLKSTEICLIGMKGKLKNIKNGNNVKGLVFAERTEHSKELDCIRNKIIELCGDKPRIELFARQKIDGWDAWGNEV